MSDHAKPITIYRVKFAGSYSGTACVGDCKVICKVDGIRKRKMFNSSQEAVEFCIENGVDRFYVFVPDEKWNCYTIEREGGSRMSQPESKEKKQVSMAELKRENETLRHIIYEISWMARRYAHGRATYAPDMYNRAITAAVKLNVKLNEADHESVYADDGCLGKWVPERQRFEKEITRTELPIDYSADTNDKT